MIEGWTVRVKHLSSRFIPLFLIVFGVTGLFAWPISGIYLTSTVRGVESTLDSAIAELQSVEQTLIDSYINLEGLEKPMESFTGRLESIVESVNTSFTSLLEVSQGLNTISSTLIQASENWALRLISEDFAESLRGAGESFKDLSRTIQEVKLQELLSEVKALKPIFEGGIKILSFLKALIKALSNIVGTVIGRIIDLKATIRAVKNAMLILITDAALIHLSTALIGLTLSQKRSNNQ